LTRSLSQVFGDMIDEIAAHGGAVEEIAGDAILALWIVGDDLDLAAATRSARLSSVALQKRLDAIELGATRR
jgi:class 3 adenylate cyclase